MTRNLDEREARLLEAHAAGRFAELVELYSERARELEKDDLNAACFYMTNAYVFALELGNVSDDFHAFLLRHNRDEVHAPL